MAVVQHKSGLWVDGEVKAGDAGFQFGSSAGTKLYRSGSVTRLDAAGQLLFSDGGSSSINMNGSGVVSVTAPLGWYVNSVPYASSQHAAGRVGYLTSGVTASLTYANGGITAGTNSIVHRSGRQYKCHVKINDSVASGNPTWQITCRVAGSDIGYLRWVAGTGIVSHGFDFWYTATSTGVVDFRFDRQTGAGDLVLTGIHGTVSWGAAIQAVVTDEGPA